MVPYNIPRLSDVRLDWKRNVAKLTFLDTKASGITPILPCFLQYLCRESKGERFPVLINYRFDLVEVGLNHRG